MFRNRILNWLSKNADLVVKSLKVTGRNTVYTNTIAEQTTDSGVTVDSCLIKDGIAANSSLFNSQADTDFIKKDGSVGMTGSLDLNGNSLVDVGQVQGENSDRLILRGSPYVSAMIYAYAGNEGTYPGYIRMFTSNEGASAWNEVIRITGNTNSPKINLYYDLCIDTIQEYTANNGVTIDGCLIKDNMVANASQLNGLTKDDVLNLSSRITTNEDDIDNLSSSVKTNTDDINNLSSLQDDYLNLSLTRKLTGHKLYFTEYGHITPYPSDQYLIISGGEGTEDPLITLRGHEYSSYPGEILIYTSDAAGYPQKIVEIEGMTDNPYVQISGGLKVDKISELTNNSGVTIDSCLIKDGIVANSSKLNGLTKNDILNLSSRVTTNEDDIDNLSSSVKTNTDDIDNLSSLQDDYLLLDGSRKMTGDLNINDKSIFDADNPYWWFDFDPRWLYVKGIDYGSGSHGAICFNSFDGTNWWNTDGVCIDFHLNEFQIPSSMTLTVHQLEVNTITEQTADSGVTIENCTHKDGWTYIKQNTPANSTATGETGQICYDNNYLYVAIGNNSWKRVSLSSW